MSVITISYKVEGFLKIYDPINGEVFVDKKNAINYENMSIAIATTLSARGYGEIYEMASSCGCYFTSNSFLSTKLGFAIIIIVCVFLVIGVT